MDGAYNHHFYETAFYYVRENEGKKWGQWVKWATSVSR